MDTRDDVFVLYSQFIEDPMPMEEVFNNGAIDTIRFGIAVLCVQYVANAFGGHMATLPWTLHPGL